MEEFGHVSLNLENLIENKRISKNKLAQKAEVSYTQLTKFCKNEISRIDLNTIARLCYVLDCDISDLLKYEKPKL